MAKAESIAKFIARPMMFMSKVAYPLLWILAKSSSFISKLLGLIIDILEEIPKEGQKIRWHDFTFEIVDMDAARIDKVLVVEN